MNKQYYQSILLRKASSSDLKMIESEKLVLKINQLIWIKDDRSGSPLDFFGPICLTNSTKKEELQKIQRLLSENRVFIINDSFSFIPDNLIENRYGINNE